MGVIKNPLILKFLSFLEWISYKSADNCIGLAPGICDEIISKNVDPEKYFSFQMLVIWKYSSHQNSEKIVPNIIFKTKIRNADSVKFLAAFTGAHGLANGLDAVLDGAKKIQELGRKDINILFIGDGSMKLKLQKRANSEGIKNCYFINSVSKIQLAKIIQKM